MLKKKKTKLAKNLKRLKKERGFSQTDLSVKTGLAYHTVAKIESGHTPDPRVMTVQKIAKAFGVSVDQLLS